MTLDLAIATHGHEGIRKVEKMLLPPQDGVRYVVSWQEHGGTPLPEYVRRRDDVEVWRLEKKGLSNNRNNAIAHCRADIVLIADDDLIYYADSFQRVIKVFESDGNLDLATFRVNFRQAKSYPEDGCRLGVPLPKGYFVTSMEIAFRRESTFGLSFNPLLGLGAPALHCGEEEMYLLDAIKRGLVCRHVAEYICHHPTDTTGCRATPGILMGQGYVIRRYYNMSAFPRLILKAYRISKSGNMSFYRALRFLAKGAMKRL